MPTVTKQSARWFQAGDFGIFVNAAGPTVDQATHLTNAIANIAAAGGDILELPVGTESGGQAGVWIGSTVTLASNVGLYLPYGCIVQPIGSTGFAMFSLITSGSFLGWLGQVIMRENGARPELVRMEIVGQEGAS